MAPARSAALARLVVIGGFGEIGGEIGNFGEIDKREELRCREKR